MGYYILTEGSTEKLLYPIWLTYINPALEIVRKIEAVTGKNQYCIESGKGFPSILDFIERGVKKILKNKTAIDSFVLILDSEEIPPEDKKYSIQNHLTSNFPNVPFNFLVIIQPICIETWLLGNSAAHPQVPSLNLKNFSDFYNMRLLDPEILPPLTGPIKHDFNLRAEFCLKYLKTLIHQVTNSNQSYGKKNISFVNNKAYFNNLVSRSQAGNEMKYFFEMVNTLRPN